MKVECDKLTEELTQNKEENTKLKRKCEFVKQELEKKVKLTDLTMICFSPDRYLK